MNTQHTPGPWTFHGLAISTVAKWQDGNKTEIEIATAYHVDNRIAGEQEDTDSQYIEDYDEAYANARLIAAAPDLLAALQYIVGWTPENWDGEKARDMAKAAIAKATEAP